MESKWLVRAVGQVNSMSCRCSQMPLPSLGSHSSQLDFSTASASAFSHRNDHSCAPPSLVLAQNTRKLFDALPILPPHSASKAAIPPLLERLHCEQNGDTPIVRPYELASYGDDLTGVSADLSTCPRAQRQSEQTRVSLAIAVTPAPEGNHFEVHRQLRRGDHRGICCHEEDGRLVNTILSDARQSTHNTPHGHGPSPARAEGNQA
ncbi:hypothetical protein EJ02DRAFT_463860 [Clathrospora elynae]|uniref:Uncharacterized protein n=1 Tax=Clathrospora elynae TaxID=706981 RepID=A0A6A5SXT6_9PLEO|nr:hypothetical protein EJ02DRAFT_463860 [Clathrospora elynae]